MLEALAKDLWITNGPVADVAGFRYPTRMAIIRLSDGGLFIWSPTPLSQKLKAQVDDLGQVRFITAPNSLHHLFVAGWRNAYPDAQLFAAPGLRKKCPDLRFDGDLKDQPNAGWAADIDQVIFLGNWITTEVVFFHRPSGTVFFTDLIQHFSADWFAGWRSLIAHLDLLTGPEPEVPRKFRYTFFNRHAARKAIRYVLTWPAEKVLMAHAEPVTENGREFIRQRFRWLHP